MWLRLRFSPLNKNSNIMQAYLNILYTVVCYIFASLFFKSKRLKGICQTRKHVFLFYFKSSFRSGENQILIF